MSTRCEALGLDAGYSPELPDFASCSTSRLGFIPHTRGSFASCGDAARPLHYCLDRVGIPNTADTCERVEAQMNERALYEEKQPKEEAIALPRAWYPPTRRAGWPAPFVWGLRFACAVIRSGVRAVEYFTRGRYAHAVSRASAEPERAQTPDHSDFTFPTEWARVVQSMSVRPLGGYLFSGRHI